MSDNIAVACAKFVMWAMMDGSWEGADIDGGAAQDKAEALGLIVETIYDPEKHGKSDCCDPGDTWYEPSEKLVALLSAPQPVAVAQSAKVPDEDWRDDPGADERWNAGCDFALEQLGKYLGIDLASITWDGATETVEGDVEAVIGNILRAKYGEDWGPSLASPAQSSWLIEWPEDDNVPVRWWNPATGWMRDANKAVHFCREQDAADYIASGNWAAVVKPTEHVFVSSVSSTDGHPATCIFPNCGCMSSAPGVCRLTLTSSTDREGK